VNILGIDRAVDFFRFATSRFRAWLEKTDKETGLASRELTSPVFDAGGLGAALPSLLNRSQVFSLGKLIYIVRTAWSNNFCRAFKNHVSEQRGPK